ncbi:MAG: hypothetical protein JWN76_474 [Chitinophagaceae bacterium]|nr:hypothetical protein [Chitinophagaceae bacterium]
MYTPSEIWKQDTKFLFFFTKTLALKKTLPLLMLSSLAFFFSNAQEEPFKYITIDNIHVYEYDLINENADKDKIRIVLPGIKFRVIGEKRTANALGDVYVIQFDKITGEAAAYKADKTLINSTNTGGEAYYCVKANEFTDKFVKKHYRILLYNAKWNIGTLIVPVKIRPAVDGAAKDFTTDVGVGASLGLSARISHYNPHYLSIVGFFGPSAVNVDSVSTKGYEKKPGTKWISLTGGMGVILELGAFQVGYVLGRDFIGGQNGKNYIYNNKPWHSFGIGYQFVKKGN